MFSASLSDVLGSSIFMVFHMPSCCRVYYDLVIYIAGQAPFRLEVKSSASENLLNSSGHRESFSVLRKSFSFSIILNV